MAIPFPDPIVVFIGFVLVGSFTSVSACVVK